MFLKGIHYRSRFFYDLQNRLKLGRDYERRFRIASSYVRPGESVVDLCAGFGQLKEFLPADCGYHAVEASLPFADILKQKNIPVTVANLHEGLPPGVKADAAVMIVSLCHFRDTSAGELLESLKSAASKVIIVEDVLEKSRSKWVARAMNYLCAADYYRPIELFFAEEFQTLMQRHRFDCRSIDGRYWVGSYGVLDV